MEGKIRVWIAPRDVPPGKDFAYDAQDTHPTINSRPHVGLGTKLKLHSSLFIGLILAQLGLVACAPKDNYVDTTPTINTPPIVEATATPAEIALSK
ncbi:MAG: hypothetical protein MUO42_07700, partial [Anaerolineaceae bacterium]|nr:hypothetical protein [Anaerolineaceae bacterium]